MITIAGETFTWIDGLVVVIGAWAIVMLWKLFRSWREM